MEAVPDAINAQMALLHGADPHRIFLLLPTMQWHCPVIYILLDIPIHYVVFLQAGQPRKGCEEAQQALCPITAVPVRTLTQDRNLLVAGAWILQCPSGAVPANFVQSSNEGLVLTFKSPLAEVQRCSLQLLGALTFNLPSAKAQEGKPLR